MKACMVDQEHSPVVMAYSQLDRSPLAGTELSDYSELAVSGLGNSFLILPIPGASPFTTVDSGPYAGTYNIYESIPDASCVATKGILLPQAAPAPGMRSCMI